MIMMGNVQILESSSSEDNKANILEVLLNIYYILGRSLTLNKKYPCKMCIFFVCFNFLVQAYTCIGMNNGPLILHHFST